MLKTNYHTHTNYCDGKNTIEQMILSAIDNKIDILGFSSHACYPFASAYSIPTQQIPNYINEIKLLSDRYKEKITVLCGFEADYIQGISTPTKEQYADFSPDFLIASVHFILTKDGHFEIDGNEKHVKAGIEKYFNGNAKNAVCEYFATQREMLKKTNAEIWGHADLCRKQNSCLNMFNEKDEWYINELKATADIAKKIGIIAEVNTGPIARGAMNDVYPSLHFLQIMNERNIPITLSSDCHKAEFIAYAFDKATKIAQNAGYKELSYITKDKKISFQKIT